MLSLFNDAREYNKAPQPVQITVSPDVIDAIEKSRQRTRDNSRTEPPEPEEQ